MASDLLHEDRGGGGGEKPQDRAQIESQMHAYDTHGKDVYGFLVPLMNALILLSLLLLSSRGGGVLH